MLFRFTDKLEVVRKAKLKRPMWKKTKSPQRLEKLAQTMGNAVTVDLVHGLTSFRKKIPNPEVIYEAWIKGDYAGIYQTIPWDDFPNHFGAAKASLLAGMKVASQIGLEALPAQAHEHLRYDYSNPAIQNIFEKRTGEWITNIKQDTQLSIQGVVHRQFTEGLSPRQMAGEIRNMVGLYPRLANAHVSYVNGLRAQGLSEDKIKSMGDKYYNKLLDYRAQTIARTESQFMINRGQLSVWKSAQANGLLSENAVKVWQVDGDPCPECIAMDGIAVRLNEAWYTEDGDGPFDIPTEIHPNCFPAGQQVLTFDGYKPIESVRIGERVLTHLGNWKRVVNTMRRPYDGELVTLDLGKSGVSSTMDHPHLIDGVWKPASEIAKGDYGVNVAVVQSPSNDGPGYTQLLSNGEDEHSRNIKACDVFNRNTESSHVASPVVIVSTSKRHFSGDVYNLTVEDDHSFVCQGLVTHNCLCIMLIEERTDEELKEDDEEAEEE